MITTVLKILYISAIQGLNVVVIALISGGYPIVPYKQQLINQRDVMIFGFLMGSPTGITGAFVNTALIGILHAMTMRIN